MLIPTQNRKAIHQYLFNEGVIVIKKDVNMSKHPDVTPSVPNLQVMKALQSLQSRGYVSHVFSWQYYYYVLTEAGIEFLRRELSLPEHVVPATVAKAMKYVPGQNERRPGGEREGGRREEGGYRRRSDSDKKSGFSGDFKPEFRSGLNRSRPSEVPSA